jgi:hypothetical protein
VRSQTGSTPGYVVSNPRADPFDFAQGRRLIDKIRGGEVFSWSIKVPPLRSAAPEIPIVPVRMVDQGPHHIPVDEVVPGLRMTA